MKRGRNKPWRIVLAVAIILVIIAGVYFGIRIYKTYRGNRNYYIFEQGFNYGYSEAVMQIINISDSCQPFPVYAGNDTRNLISVDCLGG